MPDEDREVFEAVPQRRRSDVRRGDAVVKVLSELSPLDLGEQVPVRRGDEPQVDRASSCGRRRV